MEVTYGTVCYSRNMSPSERIAFPMEAADNLGEFELLVLSGVIAAGNDACAERVYEKSESISAGRRISPSAVNTTLRRLHTKGLLGFWNEGIKRYQLTEKGSKAFGAAMPALARILETWANRVPVEIKTKPYPIRFFYNGIKGVDGKLQKCWYSNDRGYSEFVGGIRIIGVMSERFTPEIWEAFSTGSDPATYRFDPKNRIEVHPMHRLYGDAERCCKQQEGRKGIIDRVRAGRLRAGRGPSMRGPKVTARSLGHVREREQKRPRYPQV